MGVGGEGGDEPAAGDGVGNGGEFVWPDAGVDEEFLVLQADEAGVGLGHVALEDGDSVSNHVHAAPSCDKRAR